jgi:hypothetical protein
MDLRKPLILVVSLGIFLLVIFLDAYAFKVSPEHVAVLEVVDSWALCGRDMAL